MSADTLMQQKGLSLRARCAQVSRRFPGQSISVGGLWSLFRRRGISWKSMRVGYPHSEGKLAEIDSKRF